MPEVITVRTSPQKCDAPTIGGNRGIKTILDKFLRTASQDRDPRRTIRHSLFVVYGGLPDFMSDGLTTATADHAVADLVAIVADLQKRGAKRILVPGLLDMGMTPNYASQGPVIAAQATSISSYMNQKLVATLPKGVLYFDTFALYQNMRSHPDRFGLSDTVDQCYDSVSGIVCTDPNQYLFWDFVHPTEHVQIILGVEFALAAFGFEQQMDGVEVSEKPFRN